MTASGWKRHYNWDNPLSLAAVKAAYACGEEWLDQLHDYLDANFMFTAEFFASRLPKAVFRISEATYLAWADIGAYLPADADIPMFFARNAGVLLEGGKMFVQNSDGFIRLNLVCPRSILKEGLERIAKVLTQLD